MLIPILEVCRKRKRSPKCYNFQTFGEPGFPVTFTAAFRDNIRLFIDSCAEAEDYDLDGMPIWCTLLDNDNVVVPLYTVEETVAVGGGSETAVCHLCRRTGWGNGNGSSFVSRRRYHVIIPVHGDWNRQLEEETLNLSTHLLHGMIHCNGYGHLLCVNGIDGGSKHLSGREIMSLWDRICGALQTRCISVEDLSRKKTMDLRLLYGVAYGHPWVGKWGYRFNRGSFGVSDQNYYRALEILSSLQIDPIVEADGGKELNRIVRYYRDLSRTQLVKLGEFIRFMLDSKPCRCGTRKKDASSSSLLSSAGVAVSPSPITGPRSKLGQIRCRKFSSVIATLDSRWSARRMEFAAEVIVEALKEAKKTTGEGMSRQQVRDAARMHVGDTGLLDYVLKSMNNVVIGTSVVRRAVNPRTRILQYTIFDLISEKQEEQTVNTAPRVSKTEAAAPGIDVYSDLSYIYTNVLLNSTDSDLIFIATRTVLDSKQFVKEWPFIHESEHLLKLLVRIVVSKSLDFEEIKEVITLPIEANVDDLKQAIEEALADTYCNMDDAEVTFDDEFRIESGSEIVARVEFRGGTSSGFETATSWRVKCECGAQDDDGERMVACDVCEVWQHTRCVGIDDSEKAPPLFVCSGCCLVLQDEGAAKVEMIEFGNGDEEDEYLMLSDCGFEYGDSFFCS
ncbi:PHD finger protein MALE MEIOCYTE DEATH 1 [Linum perenne]